MTFHTEYITNSCDQPGRFCTYLVAPTEDAAKVMIYKRNLGERIQYSNAWDKFSPAIDSSPEFFHWLVFLTFIASKAGYTTDQLVADGGIIHELVHQINDINSCGPRGEDSHWTVVLKAYKALLEDIGYGPPEKEEKPIALRRVRELSYEI